MFREDVLEGRRILVTGGGSGLGRAMAERLAAVGARVAVVGRREDPLRETVEAIRRAGGEATWATADVRDPDAVEAAVAAAEEGIGSVDGLVNNAAGNFLAATEELSPNGFDAVVRIVLHGTFHATHAVGRRWIERGTEGAILSILTNYVWTGSAFVVPSACAKAGVHAMMQSLAVEWGPYGIRCNGLAPGPVPTEGAFSRLVAPGMEEEGKRGVPLGRFGEPGEVADLAVYLMSPMASWMNGECVTLDGGEWLKTGQEFGRLTDRPRDRVKEMLAAMAPSKKG